MEKTYEKLYENLKEQFDFFLKHKHRCPKKCKYCREWYKEVLKRTKLIKDKHLRENLTELWKNLYLNNCKDFDIIASVFDPRK